MKEDDCISTYTYDDVKRVAETKGLELLSQDKEYSWCSYIDLKDRDGYWYSIRVRDLYDRLRRNKVHANNKYSIQNIELYLEKNNVQFKCISERYTNAKTDMMFACQRCGEVVITTWQKINRNDNTNRHHILCPNCDGRTESLHALVLKQMFKHHYPDTIEEEKSCRNPKTNKIMPTDIVNHRMKIAIEIQSQWHDLKDKHDSDVYKKEFWLNKGYQFYDPDIRDYTIFEMCQLFFDIDELPNYINYEYSNKLNIKKIQKMLDDGMSVVDIETQTENNRHRIYDAIYAGKLKYPDHYRNACFKAIVQLDHNGILVNEFDSLAEAERNSGVSQKAIGRALNRGRHYSGGYYWYFKSEYDSKSIQLKSRNSHFYISVNKYDRQGNYICSYETVMDAAKDNNVSNTQVYKVISGKINQTGGFVFRAA